RVEQFTFTEPDKVFKRRRQKLFRVGHLKVGFHAFSANSRLKQVLHGGKSAAVAQAIGGVLQVVAGALRVNLQARGAHQVLFTIAFRARYQHANQVIPVGGAGQRGQQAKEEQE